MFFTLLITVIVGFTQPIKAQGSLTHFKICSTEEFQKFQIGTTSEKGTLFELQPECFIQDSCMVFKSYSPSNIAMSRLAYNNRFYNLYGYTGDTTLVQLDKDSLTIGGNLKDIISFRNSHQVSKGSTLTNSMLTISNSKELMFHYNSYIESNLAPYNDLVAINNIDDLHLIYIDIYMELVGFYSRSLLELPKFVVSKFDRSPLFTSVLNKINSDATVRYCFASQYTLVSFLKYFETGIDYTDSLWKIYPTFKKYEFLQDTILKGNLMFNSIFRIYTLWVDDPKKKQVINQFREYYPNHEGNDILQSMLEPKGFSYKILEHDSLSIAEVIESELQSSNKIYLAVWGVWCLPCKKDHNDYTLEKVEEMTRMGIKILNICIGSKIEKWKNYLEKKRIPGLHYYANSKSKDALKELLNHDLSAPFPIPRYAIFEGNSQCTNDNAPRPSSIIEYLKSIEY